MRVTIATRAKTGYLVGNTIRCRQIQYASASGPIRVCAYFIFCDKQQFISSRPHHHHAEPANLWIEGMTQHPAKNVNGPIRKFSVPKEFCSTEFLSRPFVTEINANAWANRTNRKRRTHHGGNKPNRDQKIPLPHCFSVIWCAAGARGIARFEKVLWEKEYFCMAFQCMFGKQLVAQTVRVSALQLARRPAHRTKPIGEEETILEKVIVARQPSFSLFEQNIIFSTLSSIDCRR